MDLEFETRKVKDLCKVAENRNFTEIVEDFLTQELARTVHIKNGILHITAKGEAAELDAISEILENIFTFHDFKCIFLCQLFKLNDIAYTFAKMYKVDIDKSIEINKIAKITAGEETAATIPPVSNVPPITMPLVSNIKGLANKTPALFNSP